MPAHKHAELMRLYAEDALETDEPWRRWECRARYGLESDWRTCEIPLMFQPALDFRRKPKTSRERFEEWRYRNEDEVGLDVLWAAWQEAERQTNVAELKAENARLREEIENLNSPVTKSEWQMLKAQLAEAREALKSIAANGCCDGCQEAALVAKTALAGEGE